MQQCRVRICLLKLNLIGCLSLLHLLGETRKEDIIIRYYDVFCEGVECMPHSLHLVDP